MRDKFDDEQRVFYSVYGIGPFDVAAVANALRNQSLTPIAAKGLANLLEGKHPKGLRLKLVGGSRKRMTLLEEAQKYDECMAMGQMMERLRADGLSWEDATIDTAAHFGVSESTVSRQCRLYQIVQDIE